MLSRRAAAPNRGATPRVLQVGINFVFPPERRLAPTMKSHRLVELARTKGLLVRHAMARARQGRAEGRTVISLQGHRTR